MNENQMDDRVYILFQWEPWVEGLAYKEDLIAI
jgi:hypothetical protein